MPLLGSFARMGALLGVSLALAAGYAALRRVPWAPSAAEVRKVLSRQSREAEFQQRMKQIRAERGISLEEFLAAIEEGAVIIDARPASEFVKGHLAAPNNRVLNVHGEDAAEHIGRVASLMGERIVLYCTSRTCELAEEAFIALEDAGFMAADMSIYFDGWEDGILPNNLPTTTGPDTWDGSLGGAASPAHSDDAETTEPNSGEAGRATP